MSEFGNAYHVGLPGDSNTTRFEDCPINIQVERYERAIQVLENLSEHDRTRHWDMSVWLKTTECGTIGCAAGHMSFDPYFRELGLTIMLVETPGMSQHTVAGEPVYEAVHWIMGREGAKNIFFWDEPRGVETVIEEMRTHISFLKGEGPGIVGRTDDGYEAVVDDDYDGDEW
jgi:hypothetical protein